MKKLCTLLVLCSLAMGMSWAAESTLKRITPVQLAQMRFNSLHEKAEVAGLNREVLQGGQSVESDIVGQAVPALEVIAPVRVSGRDWTRLDVNAPHALVLRKERLRMNLSQGEYDISWYSATQKEYELTTSAQMAGFSALLLNGYNLDNYVIRLGADVDLSAYRWTPVGTENYPFNGTFDGQGHTISGLNVTAEKYAGLFGCLKNAEIRNVMLAADCQIDGEYAGALAGKSSGGSVTNCVSEASVEGFQSGGFIGTAEGTRFELCVANGSVSRRDQGGWEGLFSGTAVEGFTGSDQLVQLSVSPLEAYPDSMEISFKAYQNMNFIIGGKVKDDGRLYIPMGQLLGISDEYSLYLMGITGTSAYFDKDFVGTLSDDGFSITISAPDSDVFSVALIPQSGESWQAIEYLMLPFTLQKQSNGESGPFTGSGGLGWNHCYYRIDYSADLTNETGMPQSASDMKSSLLVETLNGHVATLGDMTPQISYQLWKVGTSCPVLSEEVYKAASWGTESNNDTSWYDASQSEFVLTTAAQLAGLSRLVDEGVNFRYCTVRLGADVDLSAFQWEPVGSIETPFRGLFDGDGHTISGLRTGQNNSHGGLFGVVELADIRNLYLADDCEIFGSVAGSVAGQMTNSSIMNCRSDAQVSGNTAGGLAGNAMGSSLLASIFNGQIVQQDLLSEWEGHYSASVLSPFVGEEEILWPVDIIISSSSLPNEYILTWSSSRYELTYTLSAVLGTDGNLHIPMGQQVGTYSSTYVIVLESLVSDDELVASLSEDKERITFSTSGAYIMMSLYQGADRYTYFDGVRMPFDATRQTESGASLGGLVGNMSQTLVEGSFYRTGCLPAGVADTEQAVPESTLLSQSQVDALNASVAEMVAGDFWIESLRRWTLGTDGPVLGTEQEVNANWWISEGNYDISWYNESQSEFSLSTPAQLAGLAYLVKNGNDFQRKTVSLAQDIDLSGHLWVPIGLETRNAELISRFGGTFDGGGHTIHHMNIDVTAYSYARGALSSPIGFFGSSNGLIRNVVLDDDCSVRLVATGAQHCYVGGICGLLNSMYIDICHNWASIEAHSVYGEVYVGGVLGFDNIFNIIYNSSNHGRITGESDYGTADVAGVVGVNGYAVNLYNAGSISGKAPTVYVGGVSAQFSQLYNAYHTGSLSAEGISVSDQQPEIFISPLSDNYGSSVENGYYDVACVADTTGLNAKGLGMQADEMKTDDFARLLTANASAIMNGDPSSATLYSWKVQAGENGGFPVFGEVIESGGWWTSEGNYDISWYDESQSEFTLSTPAQLAGLAYLSKTESFEGKTIVLDRDIDLAGLKWEPIGTIGSFMGNFDGGGHEIHNLHSEISSSTTVYVGLFGGLYRAHVAHVVLADDCTVKGPTYVGGITGQALESTIRSCVNYAEVSVESPYGIAGGIVGISVSSVIDLCENRGTVSVMLQNTGAYSSYQGYVGGIAGSIVNSESSLASVIINCSNHGEIVADATVSDAVSYIGAILAKNSSRTQLLNCYNVGGVSLAGVGYAGGIMGFNSSWIQISNCYNLGYVLADSAFPIVPAADIVENSYYWSSCVDQDGSYQGFPMSEDVMKTTGFAARLNSWSNAYNAEEPEYAAMYWLVDAKQNGGFPVFTDVDPGYSAVEAAETGVCIYPTLASSVLYVSGAIEPVCLYNLAGRIESITQPVEGVTVVDLSSLAPGIYIVRTGEHVSRIIKR